MNIDKAVTVEISKLCLQPSDVLVLKFQSYLEAKQAEQIKALMQRTFGIDQKILILDKGAELEVKQCSPANN